MIELTYGLNVKTRGLYKRAKYKDFQSFVYMLEDKRDDIVSTKSNKQRANWLSSEITLGGDFNQKNFLRNGGFVILDIDKSLSIEDSISILKRENLSYYIHNSTNNGKDGLERFRIMIPIEDKENIKTLQDLRDILYSLHLIFNEKLDKSSR